jgi:hypothetical protein
MDVVGFLPPRFNCSVLVANCKPQQFCANQTCSKPATDNSSNTTQPRADGVGPHLVERDLRGGLLGVLLPDEGAERGAPVDAPGLGREARAAAHDLLHLLDRVPRLGAEPLVEHRLGMSICGHTDGYWVWAQQRMKRDRGASSPGKMTGDACPGSGGGSSRKTVQRGKASARKGKGSGRASARGEGSGSGRTSAHGGGESAAAGRGSTGSRDSTSPSPTRGRRGVLSLDAHEERSPN